MLIYIVIVGLTAMMATNTPAHATSSSPDASYPRHRIITNVETGTITHPLIPHHAHLDRRRRELREKYGAELDTTLSPRPRISRHSQTPHNEAVITALRANDNGNSQKRDLQQQMGALYQGYGTHYVDVWIGSPTPQRQTVIVDTGSGVTAFPCSGCKGCGDEYHTDNYFKESQSTTFRALSCDECFRGSCKSSGGKKICQISMSYAEGSKWSAYEGKDLCYAGGPHDSALTVNGPMTNSENIAFDHVDPVDASQFTFEMAFGCQTSITGLFITQLADGIMGMENDNTAFWKQMYSKNAIPRQEFSLCFSRNNQSEKEGSGAGAMTLGGVDPRLHSSAMVFAKNVKSSGFYAVHLKAVYLREGGGSSAQTTKGDMARMHSMGLSETQLNSGNVIVDSGTTDSYFSRLFATPFKKAWKELTGEDYNHNPVSLSAEEIAALPAIVLVMSGFEGDIVGDEPTGNPNDIAGYVGDNNELSPNPRDVVVVIPASHYMELDPETNTYVARFYTEEAGGSVLGANAMMGYDVYFDIARGRIGFAESNCDYMSLVLSEGTSVSNPPPNTASSKIEVIEEEQEDMAIEKEEVENRDNDGSNFADEHAAETKSQEKPDPDQSLIIDDKPTQGEQYSSKFSFVEEVLDDMKHECSSSGCRGVAALFIFVAGAIVIVFIRKAITRRRAVREYQDAELEISDLALDSYSDDEGGYTDNPPMPEIS